jgi:hypothetical protein
MAMALKLSTLIDRFDKQQDVVKEKGRLVTIAETAKKKEQIKLDKIGNEIMDRFSKDKIEGHTTGQAKAALKRVIGFNIKDWAKVTAWCHKERAYEIFQRRLNKSAILEHLEARKGRPVPGVSQFQKVTLSVTKVKK